MAPGSTNSPHSPTPGQDPERVPAGRYQALLAAACRFAGVAQDRLGSALAPVGLPSAYLRVQFGHRHGRQRSGSRVSTREAGVRRRCRNCSCNQRCAILPCFPAFHQLSRAALGGTFPLVSPVPAPCCHWPGNDRCASPCRPGLTWRTAAGNQLEPGAGVHFLEIKGGLSCRT